MKHIYISSLILGMMCFTTNTAQSQNILFDGDFSVTTEIISFETYPPPTNVWAFWVNSENGSEANPTVVDGICNFQIINPGFEMWNVQLGQWGFPLNLGNSYQISFDVKADAYRTFGVFLGEEGGNYTNLVRYENYFYLATPEWQTITINFVATSVFGLHKMSFEVGADGTTTYFDNIILQDLGPAPPDKVVIAGTFQSALNCASDWEPNCDYTELTFNSSTGLYTGTFLIPEGNNRYKVTVGGSWSINYGENGIMDGADIFLCVPSGSEEITFTYDPSTHLVTTSPLTSGFSPDCLPLVVLAGSFQDEIGCFGDWVPDCTNTALIYNSGSGLFEGDFNIPTGCYEYRVVLENSWQNSFGQEGIHNGLNYIIYIPENPDIIHFTYDPVTHVVNSTPYSGVPQEVTNVSLIGSLQDELGCAYDGEYDCDKPALILNSETGAWEGSFTLPAGCYTYRVKETFGCNITFYGESGIEWGNDIQLYIPEDGEINFSYNPQTHILSSTPYSGTPQEVTKVSLIGSLQDELGCAYDGEYECDKPELSLNSQTGIWEGSFTLPAGCYTYRVKETFGCNVTFYGENGNEGWPEIQLYVPADGEITFSYDPQTHILSSTPYSGVSPEPIKVSLIGSLQNELGCAYDGEYYCDQPALNLNSETGAWEGSFTLPAGCYSYRIKETSVCNGLTFYGENGNEWPEIQLYVPSDGEITFSYNPQTHIISSTPYSGVPEEVTKVSLIGSLQDELGCAYDLDYECGQPALLFDPDSGAWTGSFTLPAGCYTYRVKETFGCIETFYGENGIEWSDEILLYVPAEGEITFSYDPQTHLMSSTPYSGAEQEVIAVSLFGSLQDELGCASEYDEECDNSDLVFNSDSGAWEGTFTLPEGCYFYRVKETFVCNNVTFYGENGIEWGNLIELYVPAESEITFSYDPRNHILSSTPYNGAAEGVAKVSLIGTLQDELGCSYDYDYECENPALTKNELTGKWEGSFTLPAGCYNYSVQKTDVCGNISYYSDNGISGMHGIQLIVPSPALITFSYDPETHIINSTPYNGTELGISSISLYGTFQTELGCDNDYDYACDIPALNKNEISGLWEGSFIIPAGCYSYKVKETVGCNDINYYGKDGQISGDYIELYIPADGEITFSYDAETHIITSTPFSGVPQEVTKVSLYGTLQDESGCVSDYDYECDNPALEFNSDSGAWEGSFMLPAGCYSYRVKETSACNINFYGENGIEWGNEIQLYIPEDGEINFSYNPETHMIISTPYSGVPQEVNKISLVGTFQNELGCDFDYDYDCDNPALEFNPASGYWEGSFLLPAGCYLYRVKETSVCNTNYYGENGIEWGSDIQLYIPIDSEINFIYNPQTHIMSSTPFSGAPQEVTKVSLTGSLQNELGCADDYDFDCDSPSLAFNSGSGAWEGSFTLPAGCYTYWVKETFGCDSISLYGENGIQGGTEVQLLIPLDSEITFSYNPQTHILTSTPYSGAPQEVNKVSLTGTLQDELGCANDFDYGCENPALELNAELGTWEGSFTLPAGCYSFWVKETIGCSIVSFYGENGIEWGSVIQLYVPADGEITFIYDPQTHILSSTPYNGAPQEVTKVSLTGSLQDELGCAYDGEYECDKPALVLNAVSGMWEGSFTLPAGCYFYWVKETVGCIETTFYGENGEIYGNYIPLFVPSEGEYTFIYDPQTHIMISTPYTDISTANQCPENISVNNTPGICGAIVDYPEFIETAYCGGEIISIIQTEGLSSGSQFPVGTTTNTFVLTKITGEEITCSFDVVVIDTEVPVISDLNQTYEPLWPPNHKMVPVFIEYFTSDNCNIASTELIISSNEPETGQGNGDLAPDWEVLDEHNVLLRAERSAKGNGREYYITIKVTDSSGNFTERFVTVKVPRDNGKKSEDFSESEPGNNKYILYPNAADDIINIKGPKPITNSAYVIYDMLGVMRKQGKINNDPIEVISLPSGVYILKFEVDREYIFKKFIKN
ncbi:MAG: T9SS type A sorting domain-containing protein [Gillisia sp.]